MSGQFPIVSRWSASGDFSRYFVRADLVRLFARCSWRGSRGMGGTLIVPLTFQTGFHRNTGAHSILQSFGGLSLLSYDDEFPDEPTAELEFRPLTLKDKTATIWSRLLRSKVVGIGYGHNQHENVYADADGRIYGGSLMHDAFYLRGLTLPDCFHNLLTSTRARPMLRPDQRSVMLYGVTFTSASEEVHQYKQTK